MNALHQVILDEVIYSPLKIKREKSLPAAGFFHAFQQGKRVYGTY